MPALDRILDPDRRWFSKDKWQHFAGGVALGFVAAWFESPYRALFDTTALGFTFEVGQYDAARGTPYLGQVGYGFGVIDWIAVIVGGFVGIGIRLLFK